MRLPKHVGYFRKSFLEKYGILPQKVRVQRSFDTGNDYSIFVVPADTRLDDEDRALIVNEQEETLELAVRNYNFKFAALERFNEAGILAPIHRYTGKGLNRKYIEGFKDSFRRMFGEEPRKLCIWRNMETRETYAFFSCPVDIGKVDPLDTDTLVEMGVSYEGYLVRYRQMDKVPMSFFSEEGFKLDRRSAADLGIPYSELRTDTDDYRKDMTAEQIMQAKIRDAQAARVRFSELSEEQKEERRLRNREYYRQKSGYYLRHPQREPELPEAVDVIREVRAPSLETNRDKDMLRERELETKDPITDEELDELDAVRERLYGEATE